MRTYNIEYTPYLLRDLKKLSKDKKTISKIKIVFKNLSQNPFDTSLRTHQVNIPSLGKVYSSRVTGDLRLIWIFGENKNVSLIALRLQGHDTVYS